MSSVVLARSLQCGAQPYPPMMPRLHQAVQRNPLEAVSLMVALSAIRRKQEEASDRLEDLFGPVAHVRGNSVVAGFVRMSRLMSPCGLCSPSPGAAGIVTRGTSSAVASALQSSKRSRSTIRLPQG